MNEYRSPLTNNDLLKVANRLRSELPFYMQYGDDIKEDSDLEPEEVKNGYGETEKEIMDD